MLLIDSEDFSAAEWLIIFEHIAKAFQSFKNAPADTKKTIPAEWFESNFKVAINRLGVYGRSR